MRFGLILMSALFLLSCSLENLKQCDSGMLYCNGECVVSSATHCGSCNNVCARDEACVDGSCVLQCELGKVNCGGGCLSKDSLKIESCEGGNLVCKLGYGNCDGDVLNGCETNLKSDRSHCGRCGRSCFGDLLCGNGECDEKCDHKYRRCHTKCISDNQCCYDTECKARDHATVQCTELNECSWECETGYKPCGDICIPEDGCCFDTDCEVKEHKIAQCTETHQCKWHCVPGYNTCDDKCIPNDRCCRDKDCYTIANGKVLCVDHTCEKSCDFGYKLCKNGTCVQGDAQACCEDEDCSEHQLCDKATNRCVRGVQCENAVFYCYEPCQCIEDRCKHAAQSTYKCQKRLY